MLLVHVLQNERYEILRTLSNDVRMSNDVNLQELAKASSTQDYTGADLKALLYNAQLSAVHKALDERKQGTLKSRSRVSMSSEGSPDTSVKSGGGGYHSPKVFRWTEEGVEQQAAVPKDIELKVRIFRSIVFLLKLSDPFMRNFERSKLLYRPWFFKSRPHVHRSGPLRVYVCASVHVGVDLARNEVLIL